jgi:energy-coupling factor transporter ATP-binding protein EcfA2
MIKLADFQYRYPKSSAWALDSINLEIPKGQFCAVVGPNGAGKSTFCYALSGFVPHFFHGEWNGKLSIGSLEVGNTSLGELSAEVGLVFQNPFNQISGARFTVREEIAFGLENLGLGRPEMKERIAHSMEIVGVADLANRSPFALSGGQQQRVAIASILAMRPKVLVLDEPTSQLDPGGSEEVFTALNAMANEGDTTVVLVEHKLEWVAAFADRVIHLHAGRVVADGPASEVLVSKEAAKYGLEETKFTAVARAALEAGLVSNKASLPVTLDQSKAFFS